MSDVLVERSCADFVENLAAKVSVPGGGAAAAYAGALGIALGNMAANFSVGKKAAAAFEDDLQRLLAEGNMVRARLLKLVDEDAQAFQPLAKAYGMSPDDPLRAETIETATRAALQPPLEIMRQVVHSIKLLEELAEKSSRMLLSDVGCGAALAAAALQAASINVFVNTKTLKDRTFAAQIEAECDELLAFVARAHAVTKSIVNEIREV